MENRKRYMIFHSIIATYFICVAAVLLSLVLAKVVHKTWFLGLIMFACALPELALFFFDKHFRDKKFFSNLIIETAGLLAGIYIWAHGDMNLEIVCIIWGIVDILRGINSIVQSVIDIKKDKLIIIKLVIGIIGLTVGIMLCIELTNGINFHLIMQAVSILLLATIEGLKMYLIRIGKYHEIY